MIYFISRRNKYGEERFLKIGSNKHTWVENMADATEFMDFHTMMVRLNRFTTNKDYMYSFHGF